MNKIFSLLLLSIVLYSCTGKDGLPRGVNFLTLEDDRMLGKQVADQIEANPDQFPILKERGNEEAYRYIRKIRDKILNSGGVRHKDDFVWQVKLIDDSKTLNAFCTPGGYIYVYTGLIKYLDSEDQLAGVMGHEIAHADLRHSTRQITQMYGVSIASSALLGDEAAIKQIAEGIISLQFSRPHETEADKASVIYLCKTDYNADGAAGFFMKLEEESSSSRPPAFLSTHPAPDNRIENMRLKEIELGCTGKVKNQSEYERIKSILP